MPNLKCTVDNCVHNSECYCELEEVAIKGRSAQYSDATCCSTFCECNDSLRNEHIDSHLGIY